MKNRYIFSMLVAALFLLQYTVPSIAATVNQQKNVPEQISAMQKSTKSSRRSDTKQSAPGLSLTADAAVLLDASTGQVLFEKQAHKRRPPASTTKIMTTILALEYGDLNQIVTISEHAARVGQATIHLDPGEKITLGNLIQGALIKSGNDACVAIAEHIAGSEEAFVRLMNSKAAVLGAYDTHFANTNGLPNSNHYSTAYDLALMARYAMRLPNFAEITRTKETSIEFVQPHVTMPLRNTNKLLWMYEFADGVKTGTTNAAGKCLVSSATKNGRQLIAVVLDSPGRFADSMKLLEYGFNNFTPTKIGEAGDSVAEFSVNDGEINSVPAILTRGVEFMARSGEAAQVQRKIIWLRPHTAPIKVGAQLGVAEYWIKDRKIDEIPLISSKTVKPKGFWQRLVAG